MTVTAENPSVDYSEDGVTLAFPIPFSFAQPSDLRARRSDKLGNAVDLVAGVDFAVAGATLTPSLVSAGTVLSIWRETARTQPADYQTTAAFTAASHEQALDRGMLVSQEQDADLARTVSAPRGEVGMELPPAAVRAGGMLAFGTGSDGEGVAVVAPLRTLIQELGTTLVDDGAWGGAVITYNDGAFG